MRPELTAQRRRDTDAAGRQRRQLYAVVAVSALGGLLFGYDTGIISGALLHLREDLHLSSRTREVVVSVILLGAMVGALRSRCLAVRHGRRRVCSGWPSSSPPELMVLFQLMVAIGQLVSYLCGWLLAKHGGWRLMFALAVLPTAVLAVGMSRLPESPR